MSAPEVRQTKESSGQKQGNTGRESSLSCLTSVEGAPQEGNLGGLLFFPSLSSCWGLSLPSRELQGQVLSGDELHTSNCTAPCTGPRPLRQHSQTQPPLPLRSPLYRCPLQVIPAVGILFPGTEPNPFYTLLTLLPKHLPSSLLPRLTATQAPVTSGLGYVSIFPPGPHSASHSLE